MAVVNYELDLFLVKFAELTSKGLDVNLQLNSLRGKVSITLKSELGYVLPPPNLSCRKVKPSRARRRLRREQARSNNGGNKKAAADEHFDDARIAGAEEALSNADAAYQESMQYLSGSSTTDITNDNSKSTSSMSNNQDITDSITSV